MSSMNQFMSIAQTIKWKMKNRLEQWKERGIPIAHIYLFGVRFFSLAYISCDQNCNFRRFNWNDYDTKQLRPRTETTKNKRVIENVRFKRFIFEYVVIWFEMLPHVRRFLSPSHSFTLCGQLISQIPLYIPVVYGGRESESYIQCMCIHARFFYTFSTALFWCFHSFHLGKL